MLFNKNIIKTCVFTFSIAAYSFLLGGTVFGAVKAYSNGTSINIRSGSSTSDEVIGKLEMKQAVNAVGKENGFIKIIHEGQEGFVSSEFITVESDDGFVNEDNVNIRINGGNEVAGQLNMGDVITVTGRHGESVLFEYQGQSAFVHKKYVDSLFKDELQEITIEQLPVVYAEVASDTALNLREEPSTEASVIAKLPKGDILDVVEKGSEWTKVRTYNDVTGYVSSEFVDVKTGIKPERPAASKGLEVVAFAKQFLGTPYRYGGTNLSSGVDCSGFVYSVYKNFGITLNRSSSSMPANGQMVSKSELVAGDLVFFSNGGARNIQHVGIYCGDGTFVHSASGGNMRVMVSGMGEDYYVTNYITAARVLY